MNLNDNDRRRFYVDDIVTTYSPTAVKLAVDGTEYDCITSITGAGPYTTVATTSGFFAGPAHTTPAGATVLAYGIHNVEVRVTGSDGTTLAKEFPAFRISPSSTAQTASVSNLVGSAIVGSAIAA